MNRDDYVELGRRFARCADNQDISPDLADWLIENEQKGEDVYDWARLLEHGHVVILGEAGSGKTWELQARAELLREESKDAFFVPIERIGSWPSKQFRKSEVRQALLSRIQRIREGQDVAALDWLRGQMKGTRSRLGLADWQSLIPNFGQDIAEAARDGWKQFWRALEPVLPHERKSDGTPSEIILGLTGLAVDFADGLDPSTLRAEQVKIAVRYALHEINGFPDWFGRLAESWPGETREVFALALASESKRDSTQLAPRTYWDTWTQLGGLPASVREIVAPVVLAQLTTEPPQRGESLRIAVGALASTSEYDNARLAEAGARHLQDLNPTGTSRWMLSTRHGIQNRSPTLRRSTNGRPGLPMTCTTLLSSVSQTSVTRSREAITATGASSI